VSRRGGHPLTAALLVALTCGAPAAGRAQGATDLPADRLILPPGPDTVLGVEGGEILGHFEVDFGLRAGGLGRPFLVRNTVTGDLVATPVDAALVVEAVAAVGLWNRLQLGIGRPVTVYQSGDRLRGVADDEHLKHGVGGDLRVHAKLLLHGGLVGGGRLTIALAPFLGIPTGNEHQFAGVGGVWGEVRAALGWRTLGWLVVAYGGARLRPRTDLYGAREGPAGAAFGAAVAWEIPWRRFDHRVEVLVALDGEAAGAGRPAPVEARAGVCVRVWRGLSLAAAGGGGLDHDAGAPAWRALLEARVEPGP
jgi:hypothetical protein